MDPEKEILALRADLNDLRRFTQAIARATGVSVAVPDDATRNGKMPPCSICGEPMPQGEEMFKFHGYSGPCPKPANSPVCKCGVRLSDHEQGWEGTRTASLVRAWHRFEQPQNPHPGLPDETLVALERTQHALRDVSAAASNLANVAEDESRHDTLAKYVADVRRATEQC